MPDNSLVPEPPPAAGGRREDFQAPARSPTSGDGLLEDKSPARDGLTTYIIADRSGRNAVRLPRSSSGSTYTAWQSFSQTNLTRLLPLCYGARLSLPSQRFGHPYSLVPIFSTI